MKTLSDDSSLSSWAMRKFFPILSSMQELESVRIIEARRNRKVRQLTGAIEEWEYFYQQWHPAWNMPLAQIRISLWAILSKKRIASDSSEFVGCPVANSEYQYINHYFNLFN